MTNNLKDEVEEIIKRNELYQLAFADGLPINEGYASLVKALASLIQQEREKAEKRGAVKAYNILLKVIKDAKKIFPHSKEFEITCDVRELEKTLQFLKESGGNERD